MRLDNLEFTKSSYLGKEPEYPSYSIQLWYPNPYYGKDDEFPESPTDSDFRLDPNIPCFRIHKSCFKNKETCFVIAFFDRDKEGIYELNFVGDRPIEYLDTVEKRELFWKLVKHGYEFLNENNSEGDEG